MLTKQNLKRYAISSAITFLTFFLPVFVISMTGVQADFLAAIEAGSFSGLGGVLIRAILKATFEATMALLKSWMNDLNK